jgi:hypothetical protein
VAGQLKVKDDMIEELTSKLKECTKAMQNVKGNNRKLKEDVVLAKRAASETVETQLGDARKLIENELSKQFNSTISKQLSLKLAEKLGTGNGDAERYK